MHAAFLLGISQYPDHTLKGVSNDLALLTHALQHHNYPSSAIHVFDDSHTTRAALHTLFSEILKFRLKETKRQLGLAKDCLIA